MAIIKGHITLKDTGNNVLISFSATNYDPTGASAPIRRMKLMGRKDKLIPLHKNNEEYKYDIILKGANYKTENNLMETLKQAADSLYLYDTANSLDGVKVKIIDWRGPVIAKKKFIRGIVTFLYNPD